MLDHAPQENGTLDYCAENGIGFISFSPLAQGLLTDRYLNGIPADSRMAKEHFLKHSALTPELLEQLKKWNAEAGERDETLAEMALAKYNAEGRPIWKPMHMQPIYRMNGFITRDGNGRARTNAYIAGSCLDIGSDIFQRGLCLPSDNKMTTEQQDIIIEIIKGCFR